MYEQQIERIRELIRRYDTNKVDVLDLDGTVVDINLLTSTVSGILGYGIKQNLNYSIRKWLSENFSSYFDNPRMTTKEAIDYIEDGLFVDITEDQIQEIIHTGIEDIVKSCFSLPRTLLLAMRRRNPRRLILCITGTPQEIADIVCPLLGFDAAIGSFYPKKNGRYVEGERNFESGCNKGNILNMLTEECGIDIQDAIMVGDTKYDLDLFYRATYPIAMNPKKDLQYDLRRLSFPWWKAQKIAWIDQRLGHPMEDHLIWLPENTSRLVEADISQILPQDILELMYSIEEKRMQKWFSH